MSTDISERWRIGSDSNQVVGGDIASAATIAVTHMIHRVTGTAAIATITPPYPSFAGPVVLVPVAAFTTTTAGNIATAITAVVDRPIVVFYLPSAGKWYSHAVA